MEGRMWGWILAVAVVVRVIYVTCKPDAHEKVCPRCRQDKRISGGR
jgi:hypothetical protein